MTRLRLRLQMYGSRRIVQKIRQKRDQRGNRKRKQSGMIKELDRPAPRYLARDDRRRNSKPTGWKLDGFAAIPSAGASRRPSSWRCRNLARSCAPGRLASCSPPAQPAQTRREEERREEKERREGGRSVQGRGE